MKVLVCKYMIIINMPGAQITGSWSYRHMTEFEKLSLISGHI